MNFQKIIVAGNVTNDAKRRTAKKGDLVYTTFSVGVSDSKGRTTFFPVTVFGNQADVMAKLITKGRQVLVEGRVEVSDKGRFNIIGTGVKLGTKGGGSAK